MELLNSNSNIMNGIFYIQDIHKYYIHVHTYMLFHIVKIIFSTNTNT